MTLSEMIEQASPEAVALAEEILRSDIDNQAWAEQIGSCLSRKAVARLLGKSEQAVAQDPRLFWFRSGDGRAAYPTAQFDDTGVLAGVAEVVAILTTAGDGDIEMLSWLTAPKPRFDGHNAFEQLRMGDVDGVVELAREWAELDAAS